MHLLRTFAGPDGESHFDETELLFEMANFAPPAPTVGLSQ